MVYLAVMTQTDSAFQDARHLESQSLFRQAEQTKSVELYLRAARLEESVLADLGYAPMVLGPLAVSTASCWAAAGDWLEADRVARTYGPRVDQPWRSLLSAWILGECA